MTATSAKRASRVVWFEIPATDLKRATAFYESILLTKLRPENAGSHDLRVFPYEEPAVGGCLMQGPGVQPGASGTVAYLNADPVLEDVLKRVTPAGGKIIVPRTDLPEGMGCFAQIIDSEGNRVGLHAMS
jgi:predicted enzyme related to lactoylglutathione lyase